MTSRLRQDLDKQTEMANDFPKTLSKAAGIPKALLLKENFASEHAGVY